MAVFKHKCAGVDIKINNHDHWPPHCHVLAKGRNVKVDLYTLEPFHPPGARLTSGERKCLEEQQAAMLTAWERVEIDDPRNSSE